LTLLFCCCCLVALLWYAYDWINFAKCEPRYDGKTVLVTGASSGIGEQLAIDFIAKGAEKVIIAARSTDKLEKIKRECSDPSKM